MNKITLLAFAALLVVAAAGCSKGADPPPTGSAASSGAAAPAAVAKATFAVEGMSCASCTLTVRTAAKKVDGVVDAGADVGHKRAWASYDPKRTAPAAIAKAISEAGYPATPLDEPHAAKAAAN